MRVFDELKQRKVLQTAALYFAIAWGVTEVLSFLVQKIPVFPDWTETAIAILFVLGFPVAVFLAWMFDVGKNGVRRADPASGIGRGVVVLAVAGLLFATGALSYLLIPRIEAEKGLIQAGDIGTVAVLPFENLTGDPSLGYLGAGVAEDIRQRLALFTDLQVIGRVSIAGFAGSGVDLASIRNILDAGLIIEGSLQRIGGQLQVNIALLHTTSGRQLWANTISAKETGWGPLRQRIVTSLGEQLALTVRVKKTEAPIPDEALDAYFRALAELGQPEVADGWFDEATRLAPNFADAWARKALLRMEMMWRGMPDRQAWAEAQPLFTRAREIDPGNLLADIAEAQLLWLAKLDPDASYVVLQRAESRAANHPLIIGGLGNTLRYMPGRSDEAEAYSRRYLAQDPLNPDAHNILATALAFQNRYDEAWPIFDRALELDPGYMLAYEYKANLEFFRTSPIDALVTMTRKGQAEVTSRDETKRCMLYMAAALLPYEQAEALLRDAIDREVDRSLYHAWCASPLEALHGILVDAGRDEEAEVVRKQLVTWVESGGVVEHIGAIKPGQVSIAQCEDKLCLVREELGDEAMAAWLGPDPPLHAFSQYIAVDIASALIEVGRVEEGRRLADKAGSVFMEYGGPEGFPTVSWAAVALRVMSGDIDGALDYAEQIGPEGFAMFGKGLDSMALELNIAELDSHPRWAVLLERFHTRWMAEVGRFDRMVASGEIVMP